MSWLFPSVIATLTGTLALAFVYSYLAVIERESYIQKWALGWWIYALRYIFLLATLTLSAHPLLTICNQIAVLVSGVLLLWGTLEFLGRKLPPWSFIPAACATLWIIFGALLEMPFFLYTAPTFLFLGCVYILTGLVLLRAEAIKGVGATVTGWAFVLWGLHKMNYPLLRPVEWFAPWGYMLAALFELIVALGILLIYFQNNKAELQKTLRNLGRERHLLNMSQKMSGIGSWRHDLGNDLITWSEEQYHIYGKRPDAYIPSFLTVFEAIHPDDRERVRMEYANALKNNTEYESRHRIILPNGEIRKVDEKAEASVSEAAGADYYYGFTQDITQKHKEEEKYRNIISTSIDGFWIADKAGRILDVNSAYCVMTGYSREELLAMKISDIDANQKEEDVQVVIAKVVEEGHCRFDTVHRCKNGNCIDVAVSTAYFTDDSGIFFIFIRDITHQKKAERAMMQSEERFRMLFEFAPIPYQSLDYDGNILAVNQTWLDILGYEASEVIGLSFGEFLLGEMKDHFMYNFPRFKDKGEILGVEFEMVKKDGSIILVSFNGRIGYDVNGNFKQTHCVFQDITTQRNVEYERRLSRERMESILEFHESRSLSERDILTRAIDKAVLLTGSRFGYLHLLAGDENSIIANHWSEEAGMSSSALKMHLEGDQAEIWADCVRRRESVVHNDLPMFPEGGQFPSETISIERHLSVPIFEGKHIVAVAGVVNKDGPYIAADQHQLQLFLAGVWDIVREQRFEREQEAVSNRLKQAQKIEAVGTLAGGIAHDFNNILGVILGYAEIARDDMEQGSKVQSDLDMVIIGAKRARDLVKQILAFSRQTKTELFPLLLQPIVKECLKMLRSSIPTTIDIVEEIDTNVASVLADPSQVQQILMNLCINAYHSMESTGGELLVRLDAVRLNSLNLHAFPQLREGEYASLTVSDTGSGIGPDILERVFEPYFTTKEVGKGTGMGLAVVHGIVSNYGGTITVESQLGGGTSFHVYLPIVDIQPSDGEIGVEPIPVGRGRVLLVDDEKLLADMGREMLTRLGYHVTQRYSSQEALQLFENNAEQFDAVITDQAMPGITGVDLARRMLQIRADIPIVLYTGYSDLIDEESAKKMGIREFVFKPMTKAKLAQVMSIVLGK